MEQELNRLYIFIIAIIFIIITSSCSYKSDIPVEVLNAIDKSYSNKRELYKVIKHYKNDQDSLKLKTAYFLIAHMPQHYYYKGKELNKIKEYFPLFGKTFGNMERTEALVDSVGRLVGMTNISKLKKVNDIEVISSELLIENIDWAFKVWYKTPWHDNYSFDFFCENILPYRSQDEPLESFRPKLYKMFEWIYDSVENKNDPEIYFSFLYNYIRNHVIISNIKNFYPTDMSLSELLIAKTGSCNDESNFISLVLRTFGIPHVYDKIPSWGNRINTHGWIAFIDSMQDIRIIMFDEKHASKFGNVHASQFFKGWENENISMIPGDIDIKLQKTIAKAYRLQYSSPDISMEDMPLFKNEDIRILFNKDETCNYIQCSDVSIENPDTTKHIFLSLFNKNKFIPIALPDNHKNAILKFKGLGRNIVYFQSYLEDSTIHCQGNPFLLNEKGEISFFKPDNNTAINMTLKRKYPLFLNMIAYANYMIGGKIQGADNKDFSNAVDIYTITKTPLYLNEIILKTTASFRYYRYISPESGHADIAELIFYDENDHEIKGKIFGSAGLEGHNYDKAFDNNLASFYENKNIYKGIAGVDFGEIKKPVKKIKICPRNDTNCILPDQLYELFYWNNGWKSLGRKKSKENKIFYKNVPANSIYWLHCHSEGVEERPFTYLNGKQYFW